MSDELVKAFLAAADNLLAAQEQLVPTPTPAPDKLRTLTEAYIVARGALMYEERTLPPGYPADTVKRRAIDTRPDAEGDSRLGESVAPNGARAWEM